MAKKHSVFKFFFIPGHLPRGDKDR